MWNLKYDPNELICKTETDSHIENRLGLAKGARRGMDWEFGISRCKLLYIEQINSKVQLYRTRNYIQYSGIKP